MEGKDYLGFLKIHKPRMLWETASLNQISPRITKLWSPRPWYSLEAKSTNYFRKRSDKFLEAKDTGNYETQYCMCNLHLRKFLNSCLPETGRLCQGTEDSVIALLLNKSVVDGCAR